MVASQRLIRLALAEDLGNGDITTGALALKGRTGRALVTAKGSGVISGLEPFRRVFRTLSPTFKYRTLKGDGRTVSAGDLIISVRGPLDKMLIGERTAMNILCHLSGVATLTRAFVEAVRGFPVKIYDTRKTTPGMRQWEKKAVRDGGGYNHRMGLYDMYLLKENHIAAAGGIDEALTAAARHRKKTKAALEVEVKNLRELREVLQFEPDFVLLDNFSVSSLRKAVAVAGSLSPKIILEASGNMDLKRIGEAAATGVKRISVGRMTHSAPALDLSFRIED
jgi:nicotinate-nucleotide pyrophosphorylase (carboxylating)